MLRVYGAARPPLRVRARPAEPRASRTLLGGVVAHAAERNTPPRGRGRRRRRSRSPTSQSDLAGRRPPRWSRRAGNTVRHRERIERYCHISRRSLTPRTAPRGAEDPARRADDRIRDARAVVLSAWSAGGCGPRPFRSSPGPFRAAVRHGPPSAWTCRPGLCRGSPDLALELLRSGVALHHPSRFPRGRRRVGCGDMPFFTVWPGGGHRKPAYAISPFGPSPVISPLGGFVAIPSRAVDEATGAVTNTAPGVPLLTSWIPPPTRPFAMSGTTAVSAGSGAPLARPRGC